MQKLEAIWNTFLVDSYSLGSHWIYDEEQLKALDFDWTTFNKPAAMWHKGKIQGDFTHYGDHTLWLLEFVSQHKTFDVEVYARFWQEKMANYDGYIDGSSRETLEHLNAKKSANEGVASHDLSICGRIAPLLLVSSNKADFISNAVSFAKLTHNDPLVLEAVDFFAKLLFCIIDGQSLTLAIENSSDNYSETLSAWIDKGLKSKGEDTFTTIRTFGPACGIEDGFSGAIHLLASYDSVEAMMQANAKAGGDSSARGMIAGMILGAIADAHSDKVLKIRAYGQITKLLKGFENH